MAFRIQMNGCRLLHLFPGWGNELEVEVRAMYWLGCVCQFGKGLQHICSLLTKNVSGKQRKDVFRPLCPHVLWLTMHHYPDVLCNWTNACGLYLSG